MSSSKDKGKQFRRALQAFAESEAISDSGEENDLDIIRSTREDLDLSPYIDALTQFQSQSQQIGSRVTFDSDDDVPNAKSPPGRSSNLRQRKAGSSDVEEENEQIDQDSDSDWSDANGTQVYRAFKDRKTLKRKRAAAETRRIRAAGKAKAIAVANIVGCKPKPQAKAASSYAESSTGTLAGDAGDVAATYLDDPVPDYVTKRQGILKTLREAGLRLPPSYDEIDFSDSETEERPRLSKAIKPQRHKKDIDLIESGGTIPAPISQWLRDYQVEGVQFLHERFVKQTGAILGDDMGLGKTIQVIAFLTAAFGKTGTKCDSKRMRKCRRFDDTKWYPRILIICPGTLMQNWEGELSKWGWWQVSRYHGASPADRKGVISAAAKGMLEIMITTYTTYRNNESEINTIDWDCVIADECHQIKSKNAEITKAMNRINALCRIGLTGTAIQNKYEELWNLLNWARPGAYGSAQEWKQNMSIPLKLGQSHTATNAELANSRSKAQELVNHILPSIFLRRMKTLIADQLPKKSDRVVFCQLTETQANAYRAFLESDRCEFIRMAKEACDCGSKKPRGWCCYVELPSEGGKWATFMFPCMITLQKLANHLALIVPISSDNANKQEKDLHTLQTACPESYQDLLRIRDNILNQSQREFCGKWKVLKRLLDFWHANGDKVLIFSHSVRLLQLLRGLFDVDGTKYNFSYLDGSMKYQDRSRAVADFNADPNQFVFLISTRAGGVGLNITSANKVVVVDPNWNPAYDLQAQDRAYRIGQTRDVEVFRLVSSGTIEEIVYARQIYKQQQANIGYNASEERRYFKGVMDQSGNKGELFGLENLFTFQKNHLLLRDIMHNTNVAESKAGVNAFDFHFDESQLEAEDDDIVSDKSLGIIDDDANLAEMKTFAEQFTSTASLSSDQCTNGYKNGITKRGGPDPINAILAKAGVRYTHKNSEVIGRSEIEAKLGRQAMELRHDIDLGAKRVFAVSQSQSHSYHHTLTNSSHAYSINYAVSDADNFSDPDANVSFLSTATKGGFRINYKYRPSENVRKRQFCSMAVSMGFDDPVEFATLVENATQEERRKMLERFYRWRRTDVARE